MNKAVHHKKSIRWSLHGLYVLLFIAVFADFLANDKPLLCKVEGNWDAPVLRQYAVDLGYANWSPKFVSRDWNEHEYEFLLMPPVPYSAEYHDRNNRKFVSPFGTQDIPNWWSRHWLGTDRLGRDVLAGMIQGTRIAMAVGAVAMGIAALIGILLGGLAGYFGDTRASGTIIQVICNIIGILLGFFYSIIVRSYALLEATNLLSAILVSLLIFAGVFSLFYGLGKLLSRISILQRTVVIPVDLLIMRLIELFNSIPAILLILALISIIRKPSIYYIMLVIGLIRWTAVARFVRAELLRIRQLEYIDAAQAMGFSEWRTLFKHALPNALTPVLITLAFGVASAVILESALSFLGIGGSAESVTWGSMLALANRNIFAWWLVIFPGLGIFCTVALFNYLGEELSKNLAR